MTQNASMRQKEMLLQLSTPTTADMAPRLDQWLYHSQNHETKAMKEMEIKLGKLQFDKIIQSSNAPKVKQLWQWIQSRPSFMTMMHEEKKRRQDQDQVKLYLKTVQQELEKASKTLTLDQHLQVESSALERYLIEQHRDNVRSTLMTLDDRQEHEKQLEQVQSWLISFLKRQSVTQLDSCDTSNDQSSVSILDQSQSLLQALEKFERQMKSQHVLFRQLYDNKSPSSFSCLTPGQNNKVSSVVDPRAHVEEVLVMRDLMEEHADEDTTTEDTDQDDTMSHLRESLAEAQSKLTSVQQELVRSQENHALLLSHSEQTAAHAKSREHMTEAIQRNLLQRIHRHTCEMNELEHRYEKSQLLVRQEREKNANHQCQLKSIEALEGQVLRGKQKNDQLEAQARNSRAQYKILQEQHQKILRDAELSQRRYDAQARAWAQERQALRDQEQDLRAPFECLSTHASYHQKVDRISESAFSPSVPVMNLRVLDRSDAFEQLAHDFHDLLVYSKALEQQLNEQAAKGLIITGVAWTGFPNRRGSELENRFVKKQNIKETPVLRTRSHPMDKNIEEKHPSEEIVAGPQGSDRCELIVDPTQPAAEVSSTCEHMPLSFPSSTSQNTSPLKRRIMEK